MKILSVNDPEFRKYGRVIEGIDFSNIIKAMGDTPCPDDVVYVPSVKELEAMTLKELEIHYEAESLEGDVLRIYRKKVDDEWHFAIKKGGKVVTYAYIKN